MGNNGQGAQESLTEVEYGQVLGCKGWGCYPQEIDLAIQD